MAYIRGIGRKIWKKFPFYFQLVTRRRNIRDFQYLKDSRFPFTIHFDHASNNGHPPAHSTHSRIEIKTQLFPIIPCLNHPLIFNRIKRNAVFFHLAIKVCHQLPITLSLSLSPRKKKHDPISSRFSHRSLVDMDPRSILDVSSPPFLPIINEVVGGGGTMVW